MERLGSSGRFNLAVPAVAFALFLCKPAWAQGDVVEPPSAGQAPVTETTTPFVGPDVKIMSAGALLFAVGYVPAVAVGAGSGLAVDKRLYIPVAGPFLDLAQRKECVVGNLNCNFEIVNKFLLATDGIIQSFGILTALAGLIMTTEAPVVTTAFRGPEGVRVLPVIAQGQAGLVAEGRF
jgi:hypothetical protein